jgi:hypothetical protein
MSTRQWRCVLSTDVSNRCNDRGNETLTSSLMWWDKCCGLTVLKLFFLLLSTEIPHSKTTSSHWYVDNRGSLSSFIPNTNLPGTMLSTTAAVLLRNGARRLGSTPSASLFRPSLNLCFSSGSHDDFAPKRKTISDDDEALKIIKVRPIVVLRRYEWLPCWKPIIHFDSFSISTCVYLVWTRM